MPGLHGVHQIIDGPTIPDGPAHAFHIMHVAPDRLQVLVVAPGTRADLGQAARQNPHAVPPVQQQRNKTSPHITGGPGNQDGLAHRDLLSGWTRRLQTDMNRPIRPLTALHAPSTTQASGTAARDGSTSARHSWPQPTRTRGIRPGFRPVRQDADKQRRTARRPVPDGRDEATVCGRYDGEQEIFPAKFPLPAVPKMYISSLHNLGM